jgi:hypothetical protein
LPSLPDKKSLLAPPNSWSAPRMPRTMSSPPRASILSGPRVPLSTSLPSVPVISANPGWTATPLGWSPAPSLTTLSRL